MSRHIRQSPVDGKWRRWELKPCTILDEMDEEEYTMRRSDNSRVGYDVQVCTGVFDTKAQAKRDTFGTRRSQ